MTDEPALIAALRSAFPPVARERASHDLWPRVITRGDVRASWSWIDAAIAAGVVAALWARPDLLIGLLYHF
jgi:hypothetical protein